MSVVTTIWVFPVLDLPVANTTGVVERINEVVPCLGACWDVNVSKALLILLDHWKDEVSKLLAGSLPKGNGVEL